MKPLSTRTTSSRELPSGLSAFPHQNLAIYRSISLVHNSMLASDCFWWTDYLLQGAGFAPATQTHGVSGLLTHDIYDSTIITVFMISSMCQFR